MSLFSIKSIKECSGSVVILILILGILGSLYTTKETFISGALFPEAVSEAALSPPFGDRPMMPKGHCAPGLSNERYSTEWKLYPRTPMSSYAQVTNNKEYWQRPCNGTTLLPEMCGGLYSKIQIKKPKMSPAPAISPKRGTRVNYYVSMAGRPPEE
jgi:hypothetical protein